jgi:hypothetical protein
MNKLAGRLLPAALLAVALPASAQSVTSVTLSVSPEHSRGPCPAVFKFTGKVVLSGEGRFTYKWERSDGAIDSAAPHAASYNGSTPTLVEETWTLGAPGAPFHPFHGWARLHILTPTNKQSNEAKFILDCGAGHGNPTGGPGGPNAKCDGRPDLVPVLHTPMDGFLQVKNVGTGNAGPSELIVKCQKEGVTSGGGCADLPAAAIAPPFYSTPEGLGLHVPALACGAEFHASFPPWPNMTWSKGTFKFTATADATNAVAETNEANNQTTSTMVR